MKTKRKRKPGPPSIKQLNVRIVALERRIIKKDTLIDNGLELIREKKKEVKAMEVRIAQTLSKLRVEKRRVKSAEDKMRAVGLKIKHMPSKKILNGVPYNNWVNEITKLCKVN